MLFSNWSARYETCASVITFRTPSLRQSVGRKSSTFETQISQCPVTARSVNRRSRSSALPLREYQNFCVPSGGVVFAASALNRRVALKAVASFATPGSFSCDVSSLRTMSLPVTAATSGPFASADAGKIKPSISTPSRTALRIVSIPLSLRF